MAFSMQYGMNHQQNLDPQLHMAQMQTANMQHQVVPSQQQQLPQRSMRGSGDGQLNMQGMPGIQNMQQDQNTWTNQVSPEDTWSNSSRGQQMPVAPTTLNVEDW